MEEKRKKKRKARLYPKNCCPIFFLINRHSCVYYEKYADYSLVLNLSPSN